jgi:hypothetical protein
VARAASLGPRGCAEMVGWFGDRAGSRARRWLPGGGRRDTSSGEPAARACQQASAGDTGGPSEVRSSACLRRKAGGGGVHRVAPMADGGGRARARRRPTGFIAQLEAVEAMAWAMAWPEYGGRAATCVRPSANDGTWAARCGRCAGSTWHRSGDPHASCTGTRAQCSTQRAQACLGVCVRWPGSMPTRPGVAIPATSCAGALWLKTAPSTLL